MNNLEKEGKGRGNLFNISFNSVIYLFSCLVLIGCKEVTRWLSEAEGVSGAEAKVITAILEIKK